MFSMLHLVGSSSSNVIAAATRPTLTLLLLFNFPFFFCFSCIYSIFCFFVTFLLLVVRYCCCWLGAGCWLLAVGCCCWPHDLWRWRQFFSFSANSDPLLVFFPPQLLLHRGECAKKLDLNTGERPGDRGNYLWEKSQRPEMVFIQFQVCFSMFKY